jgi:hypothetical protein
MLTDRFHGTVPEERVAIATRIGGVAWALFFIWLGLAFFTGVSFGVGMLGVGVITLAAQVARWALHLPLEVFWLGAGALFALGGAWSILNLALPFVPLVLLVVGAVLLVSALRK